MKKFRVGDRVRKMCSSFSSIGVVTHSFSDKVYVTGVKGNEFKCYNPDHYVLLKRPCPMEVNNAIPGR